jgi:type II secretory pathway pseudopilin PulG
LGLLLGGALVPLQSRYEQEQIKKALDYMRQAKGAVMAYALQNGTVQRKVRGNDNIVYDIPPGRPYLPCPDIDGDGIEDRVEVPAAVATATVSAGGGVCDETKGALPWKTLGLQDLDPWGNRLTYRVDPSFSDSLLGFDQGVRADIFDRRASVIINSAGATGYTLRANRHQAGGIVCSSFANVTDEGCPGSNLQNVVAGVVATMSVDFGPRGIDEYDAAGDATKIESQGLASGAAFVLVSHGRNGRGAINRNNTCRALPDIINNNLSELANAYYRPNHTLVSVSACVSPPAAAGNNVSLQENLFVDSPALSTGGDGIVEHDDLVLWAGENEIIGFLLRGGLFPIGSHGMFLE